MTPEQFYKMLKDMNHEERVAWLKQLEQVAEADIKSVTNHINARYWNLDSRYQLGQPVFEMAWKGRNALRRCRR